MTEVFIYAPIGAEYQGGITAKSIVDQLEALPSSEREIRVRINSAGGNPFDAVAIAHALRDQRMTKSRTVEVSIDGLAASAASVISSAGSPIRIHEAALVFVHMPFTLTLGTADEHRSAATALDTIAESIITAYRWTSKKTANELREMMRAAT